ncbi:ATP-binding protein [Aliirhizobium smilacinae]|uniref:Chromosome segregation protein SMC n=1 Tax=Aliirhizobium smilacinae TaxID=1395944 RepID=A0A5C4XPL9_9HYPH|nr:YhaN family protein [Rhizobium smilacinae]TNM65382.1 chromosome segregation protein SMC [Rhizobium smilacinae]
MRFDRLDILRYGALTDRQLVFRPGAKLHIVYGPNEAGKSSALSAISDLLFGFPERSAYGFLHDVGVLRIGAELTARDGQSLSFRRRKGRKNTLLGHSDSEENLADDALSPFLGNLSRDVFERAFGLNSDSLRAGGETMLKSGGEIGSLLFSAASGLTGLSNLRKSLEAGADAIYSQRRSKDRSFYQVLDAHDAARKAERDNELKSGDWKSLLKEEAELGSEIQTLQHAREETKRTLDRLRRHMALEPLLRELDRERASLQHYEALAGVPAGFEAGLSKILEASRQNIEALAVSESEIARLGEEIAAIHVDEALLGAGPNILAAYSRSGVYLKAREDIARVRGEVDDFDQKLILAARRLGLRDLTDLQRAQPADADLARLRQLVEEGSDLDREMRQLRKRIDEEADALRKIEADVPLMRIVDPKPLSDQLAALRPEIEELTNLEALKIRAARARSDLDTAAARLDPPVKDIGLLLSVPLPDMETLVHHRRLIEAARQENAQALQKLVALKGDADELAGQLALLEGGGTIVSRETIGLARQQRDGLIDVLAAGPSEATLLAAKSSVEEADRLSDAALSDAERVSRHAHLTLQQRKIADAIAAAELAIRETGIAASDAMTEFEDLFHAAPLTPGAPERMIEWRRAVDGLAALSSALNAAEDEHEVLRSREETLRPALAALADATGASSGVLPPRSLAREISVRLEEITRQWSEGRTLERMRDTTSRTLMRLEADETDLRGKVDLWRSGFAAAATSAGLAEDATIEMANAALDIWRTLPDLMSERENRDRRVRGMARDMEAFEEEIVSLCRSLASDLVSVPADVAGGLLNDRVIAARAADNQRIALAAALERNRLSHDRNFAEAALLEVERAKYAEMVSVQPERLGAVLADLQERARHTASEELWRRRFADQANGLEESAVRSALVDFDKIAAGVEIERLDAEDSRQVNRLADLRAAEADNIRRRQELEKGTGAERAVFEKLAAEEEAKQLARRWVILKLAGSLLAHSMEVYREKQADPVMTRAGEVFSDLTGGRFARLVQIYDDNDDLQLAVERSTGEQVPLSGLSEGTGDQLYLALRLAFLEDYCRRNEPAPLVLDDIFQTFDDERTGAGLRTLAASSSAFQSILFTHQTSLMDAAQRELGDDVDLIRLDRA